MEGHGSASYTFVAWGDDLLATEGEVIPSLPLALLSTLIVVAGSEIITWVVGRGRGHPRAESGADTAWFWGENSFLSFFFFFFWEELALYTVS